jgi:membrane associated rhomboid family serine protease
MNEVRTYTKRFIRKNPISDLFYSLSVTNWIIIIDIVIFLLSLIQISVLGDEKFNSYFALQPKLFFSGRIWTAFSSVFLHGGAGHLFFNMISLFFIGNFVEKIIGKKRFVLFYLISGIIASLIYAGLSYFLGSICLVNMPFIGCIGEKIFINPNIYAVGASGAIFALLGLLAVLTPNNKVYLIAGPLIAIIIESITSSITKSSLILSFVSFFVMIYFLVSIFSIFSFNDNIRKISLPLQMPFYILPIIAIVPLAVIGLFIPLPIGNTAHLGGLIVGLFYSLYLKRRYKKKTEFIRKYFSR